MFFFLSVVYRLLHWHASFRTHTHTHTLKWFVVLAMRKRIVTAYKMQFSTKARKNRTHWHTEHVVCFLWTCFWQSSCNHTNTTCIGTALFSTSLSFISCLASPKQQKQNAQAQRQNPCIVLCTCSFICKAHASTDWAKRIGTVMFYCMPQLYKCISPPKQERTDVGLSRIARGEVVSFCVPAVVWWLWSYSGLVHVSFLLLCTVLLLLLHFYLDSLCFRH